MQKVFSTYLLYIISIASLILSLINFKIKEVGQLDYISIVTTLLSISVMLAIGYIIYSNSEMIDKKIDKEIKKRTESIFNELNKLTNNLYTIEYLINNIEKYEKLENTGINIKENYKALYIYSFSQTLKYKSNYIDTLNNKIKKILKFGHDKHNIDYSQINLDPNKI